MCFRATENPSKNLIEKDSERILFKPLEAFVCNNLNSEKVLNHIKELDDPPQLCGKVFKSGEPTYFCRDCGSDPTCVLCSTCFRNSKHRYHRYKMLASAGAGGYCDCGDKEAWKEYHCCDLHAPKTDTESLTPDDFINRLPNDMVQRTTQLIEYLYDYIIEILCDENLLELKSHLKFSKQDDTYVTMLFNDEIHSYEQVVSTLKKVIGIDDRKAFEYAAIVDKEGRSVIKRGTKSDCERIKSNVESNMSGNSTPALATKVMHSTLISHQVFAERIVAWMQKISTYSKSFKNLICKIGSSILSSTNFSILEKFMLSDSILWKSARSVLHQLFIATYLMDAHWKKEYSITYTKNYQLIWRNYAKNPDDTASITDLALQIFTVISLSNYLITNHNLLQIIVDSLLEHARKKINSNEKLSFERTRLRNNDEFKRAQYIIYDLKYALISLPTSWSDTLRESLLNGFKSLTQFLKYMHGMDRLKRYVTEHVEYEPEWETGFNLLIKLQRPISSIIDWTSNDSKVLYSAYNHLLEQISDCENKDPLFKYKLDKVSINDQEYNLIKYDVSSEIVSIHAPLTRVLAALHTRLALHSLDFSKFPLIESNKISVNSLIEPSLRAQVLVSQSNAGLWRRNGYSLMSQVYFYNNIRCRSEMSDRDILCLQMGASLMNSDEFIATVLDRFGLVEFLAKKKEFLENKSNDLTKIDNLIPLSEDFLQLLITICSERYEIHVGKIDAIEKMRREVIHQLCIAPQARSDLVKNIYSDSEVNATELESILREVAVFKNPTNQSGKGTYELKSDYYKFYSPYFYHYSKIEKTKSEEEQLKLRRPEERYLAPPILPQFSQAYSNIRYLLDSDLLIRIITNIINRFNPKSSSYSDGQLVRVLHLIGLALHEEKYQNDYSNSKPMRFIEKISSTIGADHFKNALRNIISKINTESYRLLTKWILEYYESFLGAQGIKSESADNDKKSDLAEKRKNQAKLKAEQRRLKILAQMGEMQKSFIRNNKDLFDSAKEEAIQQLQSKIEIEECEQNQVCLGPHKTKQLSVINAQNRYRCILCQEDQEISLNGPVMVLCCYVQHSKVLSQNRVQEIENVEKFEPLFMPSNLFWGINTTSCGHVMHGVCWQKYVDGIKASENRRHGRFFNFSTKKNEYLCPLCETIGNTVLPIVPNIKSNLVSNQSKENINITYDDWIDGLQKTLDKSVQKELNDDKNIFMFNPCPLTSITKLMAETVAQNFNLLFSSYDSSTSQNTQEIISKNPTISDDTFNMIDSFARTLFVFGLITDPNDEDLRLPITVWNNCAYTIQTFEQILRVDKKSIFSRVPERQNNLLSNLVKYSSLYAIGKKQDFVRDYCLKILAAILNSNTIFFDSVNLMNIDLFHMLVYLCFSMPHLYDKPTINSVPSGNLTDTFILKLILQAHCVQIILNKIKKDKFFESSSQDFSTAIDSADDNELMVTETEEETHVYEFFNQISKLKE